MKIGKRLGCAVSAAALCLCSLSIPAGADALMPGEWRIRECYEINSDGVMGYSGNYIYGNGEQEIEHQFQKGDIVYASIGYHSMGIDWASCCNMEPDMGNGWSIDSGFVDYGWVDMTYLSPVGSVVEEPEPDPEPVITEPPTDPPTEAPTTIEVTTIATTAVTTIFTTLAPTEAETTRLTTTTTKQTSDVLSITDHQNDNRKNNFFSDNLALLLIGGVVVLLAGSGALAIGLIQHNKKK
ncbi:MAG: hypothetical protein ACI4TG_06395 [Ruminococcus sp.]